MYLVYCAKTSLINIFIASQDIEVKPFQSGRTPTSLRNSTKAAVDAVPWRGTYVHLCVKGFHTHRVLPPSVPSTGINEHTDGHSLISSNRQQCVCVWGGGEPCEDVSWHAHHYHHSLSANKARDNWRCQQTPEENLSEILLLFFWGGGT